MKPFVILVLVLVAALVIAQPAQTPTQNPCIDAELRATLAEEAANHKDLLLKACELRDAVTKQENARLGEQLSFTGQQLAGEIRTSVHLAASNQERGAKIVARDETIAAQDETIATVTGERNKLALKIKEANGRFFCEKLNLGCVK